MNAGKEITEEELVEALGFTVDAAVQKVENSWY